MTAPIKVDIWSDVACPWCYIGKRKFEVGVAAFARNDETPIEVEYRSFVLRPDAPIEFDGTAVQYLAQAKGVPEAQIRRRYAEITAVAAEVGLAFDFDSLQPTNTIKAHQVLHLAKARGLQIEAKERLFSAHYLEGRHVGRDEELTALGADVGLDSDEILKVLKENTYLSAVQTDLDHARQLGISGVPFFVVDGRYGISGAQPAELFTRALSHVQSEGEGSAP